MSRVAEIQFNCGQFKSIRKGGALTVLRYKTIELSESEAIVV